MLKRLVVFVIIFLFVGAGVGSSTYNKIEVDSVNYQSLESTSKTKNLLACDHLAYVGSNSYFCSLYEFALNDPGNLTCYWPGQGGSGYFMSGSTWSNDGRWFACEYNTGGLWVIDLETGDMYVIGGGGTSCNGLAWDPIENRLYGTSGYDLYEYDPETGEQDYIGSHDVSNTMIALAIDSEGECYAWDVLFSGESKLFWIDLETGQAYEVGSLGITLTYAQDGDFCKLDNTLYLATYTTSPFSGNYLYECDVDTGSCTLVGQLQGDVEVALFVIPWNYPPYTPSDPIPPSGATGVPINTGLNWSGGDPDGDFVVYDIYFGNTTPPPKVASFVTDTNYDPGVLEDCTTYYWQIVTWDYNDAYTEGPIWNFTTNCGPDAPTIDGPIEGKPGVEYEYFFVSTDPEGDDVRYIIDWLTTGDYIVTPYYESGEEVVLSNIFPKKGTFKISAKAQDSYGAESDWGTLTVTIPRYKMLYYSLFLLLLDRYLSIQDLLDILGRNIEWRKEVF